MASWDDLYQLVELQLKKVYMYTEAEAFILNGLVDRFGLSCRILFSRLPIQKKSNSMDRY